MKNTDFSGIENTLRKLRPAQTPEELSLKLQNICLAKVNRPVFPLLKWIWIPIATAALLILYLNVTCEQPARPQAIVNNEGIPLFIELKSCFLTSLDTLNTEVWNTTPIRTIRCIGKEAVHSKEIIEQNLNVQKKLIQNSAIAKDIIFSPSPTYTAIMRTSRIIRKNDAEESGKFSL